MITLCHLIQCKSFFCFFLRYVEKSSKSSSPLCTIFIRSWVLTSVEIIKVSQFFLRRINHHDCLFSPALWLTHTHTANVQMNRTDHLFNLLLFSHQRTFFVSINFHLECSPLVDSIAFPFVGPMNRMIRTEKKCESEKEKMREDEMERERRRERKKSSEQEKKIRNWALFYHHFDSLVPLCVQGYIAQSAKIEINGKNGIESTWKKEAIF